MTEFKILSNIPTLSVALSRKLKQNLAYKHQQGIVFSFSKISISNAQ